MLGMDLSMVPPDAPPTNKTPPDPFSKNSNVVSPSTVSPKRVKKPTNHVKRPLNPFMVWSNIERKKILTSSPDMHNADISKQLGLRWTRLSVEERKPFIEEAERLRQLHFKEHPDYRYKPKKRVKPLQKKKMSEHGRSNQTEKSPTQSNVKKTPETKSSDFVSSPSNSKLKVVYHEPITYVKSSTETIATENIDLTTSCSNQLIGKTSPNTAKLNSRNSQHASTASQMQNSDASETSTKSDSSKQTLSSFSFALYDKACKESIIDSSKDEKLKRKASLNDSDSSEESSASVKPLSPLKSKQLTSPIKSTPRFQIDGKLTAGSISAIAFTNKDERSETLETFDFLADNLIHNSKNAAEEIKKLSKAYQTLKRGNKNESYKKFDFPECAIPNLSDILGENWNDSACKFNDLNL